jgi:hypothetical protein
MIAMTILSLSLCACGSRQSTAPMRVPSAAVINQALEHQVGSSVRAAGARTRKAIPLASRNASRKAAVNTHSRQGAFAASTDSEVSSRLQRRSFRSTPKPMSRKVRATTYRAPPVRRNTGMVTHPALPFALLRHRDSSPDRLPPSASETVRRFVAISDESDPGLGDAILRRTPVLPSLPSWVLGDRRLMCLVRAEPLLKTSKYAYAMNCVQTAEAINGFLISSIAEVPQYLGETLFEGVLPDGAAHLTVLNTAGRREKIPTHDGIYIVAGTDLRSIRFQRDGRTYVVPLPEVSHNAR